MGTPILRFVFDRKKRASKVKEGSVELCITYNRKQHWLTTGVRLLPKQWREPGQVVNRLDAFEQQRTLDTFMVQARQIVNDMMANGELDMNDVTRSLKRRQNDKASENVVPEQTFIAFCEERAVVRKYGRSEDSQERYDRFMKWFKEWGQIVDFKDITDLNVLKMDKALAAKGMKNYSKWQNYHRFLNSFFIDAREAGFVSRNPYKWLNIPKDKSSGGLGKYLTPDEFRRIASVEPPTLELERVRDVFVFQTYTCMSYVDLAAFDAKDLKLVNGRKVYTGMRGKTKQEFTFLLLKPAEKILEKYNGVLPISSNSDYNDNLKVLAMMANIKKPVSSHWARHTGATLLLNEGGMDMEVVAKVLGHSSTRITRQVYAKLLDETVVDAMSAFEMNTKIVESSEERGDIDLCDVEISDLWE